MLKITRRKFVSIPSSYAIKVILKPFHWVKSGFQLNIRLLLVLLKCQVFTRLYVYIIYSDMLKTSLSRYWILIHVFCLNNTIKTTVEYKFANFSHLFIMSSFTLFVSQILNFKSMRQILWHFDEFHWLVSKIVHFDPLSPRNLYTLR